MSLGSMDVCNSSLGFKASHKSVCQRTQPAQDLEAEFVEDLSFQTKQLGGERRDIDDEQKSNNANLTA